MHCYVCTALCNECVSSYRSLIYLSTPGDQTAQRTGHRLTGELLPGIQDWSLHQGWLSLWEPRQPGRHTPSATCRQPGGWLSDMSELPEVLLGWTCKDPKASRWPDLSDLMNPSLLVFSRPPKEPLPSRSVKVWRQWEAAWGQSASNKTRTDNHMICSSFKFKKCHFKCRVTNVWWFLVCSVTSSRENMVYSVDCLRDHMWVLEGVLVSSYISRPSWDSTSSTSSSPLSLWFLLSLHRVVTQWWSTWSTWPQRQSSGRGRCLTWPPGWRWTRPSRHKALR